MATKKPTPKAKAKPTPQPKRPTLAASARSASFGDALLDEDQLVDTSGVFRVTSAIAEAQIGHGDDNQPRFPSDSLVMAAQRDGFRERGPGLDDASEEHTIDDESTAAARRQRIATLASRQAAKPSRTRR